MAKVKGVDETIKRMKKFANDVQKAIIDGMDESTRIVLRTAREIVPVDTGKLQSSMRRKITRKRVWFTGTVGAYTKYAYYVEFGTSKMAAKPYLWPSVTRNRDYIFQLLGRHLEHAIEKNDYSGRLMRKRLI